MSLFRRRSHQTNITRCSTCAKYFEPSPSHTLACRSCFKRAQIQEIVKDSIIHDQDIGRLIRAIVKEITSSSQGLHYRQTCSDAFLDYDISNQPPAELPAGFSSLSHAEASLSLVGQEKPGKIEEIVKNILNEQLPGMCRAIIVGESRSINSQRSCYQAYQPNSAILENTTEHRTPGLQAGAIPPIVKNHRKPDFAPHATY